MSRARYTGDLEIVIPDLTALATMPIRPGDVVVVPTDFNHPHFEPTDDEPTNVRSLEAEDAPAPTPAPEPEKAKGRAKSGARRPVRPTAGDGTTEETA